MVCMVGTTQLYAQPPAAPEAGAAPEPAAPIAPDTPAAPAVEAPAPGGQEATAAPPADEIQRIPAERKMTLMMMVQQGGVILWILMALGFVGLVWALFLIATVTPRREVPPNLAKRAQAQVRAGDVRGAYQMCLERDELLANVLRAGLKMAGHDRYVIQEAMESEGERGATLLWQRISYINNIATIAPLLGFLGTVWGMMLAFSSIAFDTAQVRDVTMAYGVAMAMITTAAGLSLAIPAIIVYYFLRGRVIKIIASVEAQASEFVELLSGGRSE
ncbi:MAG: MotA/TolQ/ExbB proton channel family protein [Candidatus Hydrogenedentes bacterium]|nr:MotA/TolQ/ExbB proton channel family protein [Candidatus Hydrogenedentota bacterium]